MPAAFLVSRLTAFERMAETLKPTPIIDFERLQRTHLRAAAVLAGDRNAQCGASTQSTFPDFFRYKDTTCLLFHLSLHFVVVS